MGRWSSCVKKLRCPVNTIMREIDDAVAQFFVQALQLDDVSLQREWMRIA